MKKFGVLISCALAFGLWSCSEDKDPKGGEVDDAAGVYASIQLNLNSRSETIEPGKNPAQSDAGFEYGKDRENNVSAVLIVLATANEDGTYTYITSSGVANAYDTNNAINGTAGKPNPIYRVKFQTSALVAKAGQEVSIFAYCNPSPELAKEIADGNWNVDMSESIVAADNDAIWTPNSFLMTSALPASKILPSEFDMNNTYNKVQTPFNLGTVQVERVAARFDYAVTTEVNGEKLTADNCFPIYDYVPEENLEEGEGAVKPTIQGYVTITDLALINEAKNFYLLPRVAANTGEGKDAMADMSKVTILGKEDPTNWVISPSTQDYFYQLVEGFNPAAPGTLNFTSVSSLTEECNTENWVNATKEYKIWRYTTENTIRSVAAQKRGITTGVVFRGEISGVEGSALGESIKSGKAIYAHDGIMYGNLDSLMNYVSRNPRSGVSIDFQTAFNVTLDLGTLTTAKEIRDYLAEQNITDLAKSTELFTVYKPENGKYYVYYYYYNRHNDNHNNTQMGPMEFATVRNNVYKLRLTNILKWGKSPDEPDDPNDDDENPEVYFRVQVEVLPWVVRVNNIEF